MSKLTRKKMLIVRKGQFTYGFAFALYTVALCTGMVLASFAVFYSPSVDPVTGNPESVFSTGSLTKFFPAFFALTIPAGLLSFAMGVVLSHRTFGPMVRIQAFLEELKRGNYKAVLTLRTHDHMGELAGQLNSVAEELAKKHPGTTAGNLPKDR